MISGTVVRIARFITTIAVVACKAKSDPTPAPAPSVPAPTATMGAPVEHGEWAVATGTLPSGRVVLFDYRPVVPDRVTPADYAWRVTVRCPYPDRGDASGLPTKEQLSERQDFEERLESASAILMMSRTGEGAREMTFQVKRSDDFISGVPAAARSAGFACSSEVTPDRDWAAWRTVVADAHAGR